MRRDNQGAEPARENRSGHLPPPKVQLWRRLNSKAPQKQEGKSGQPNSKFFLSCTQNENLRICSQGFSAVDLGMERLAKLALVLMPQTD